MTAHNPSVGFSMDDKTCAVIDRAYKEQIQYSGWRSVASLHGDQFTPQSP
jgi:hypothetical protein